jgi:2-C-methyl-D-erythritol 2,4-cyclodiphosphate synthase
LRVGIGFDAHRLRVGRDLVLGGVRIEHHTGLEGHSDGDVLTHAVIDALLGAAGLGDIGRLFPDTDPKYEGADSLELLSVAVDTLRDGGYRVVNVDTTVIAQEPRLEKHLGRMAANLAERLQVEAVNVKATSPEGLGALGRQLGIAAQAVVMIEPLV